MAHSWAPCRPRHALALALALALACLGLAAAAAAATGGQPASAGGEAAPRALAESEVPEEEVEPVEGILFPWFAEVLGLVTLFLISRILHVLPYTAMLFILGVFIGAGEARLEGDNKLGASVRMWVDIDSELVLLIFLPGLLFGDALHVNFHLFEKALTQILTLAFPMVLTGTVLTAVVAKYVLPYDWPFSLCMTFGAILSATDPVAVSALLSEVGSPPRLRMLISGESMFNDGSAIVFFTIFSSMFLHELNIGLGEEYTVGEGFATFFRMSFGGALIGLVSSGLLVTAWQLLDRRLNKTDTILQVSASLAVAYLTFYVAEVVAHTSGVIAVVICGITTSAFGENLVHRPEFMEHVWGMVEHLLNTLLFVLGGVVWGAVIADQEFRDGHFRAVDWGYLMLLFLLLMLIRAFLLVAFYPLLSRIGLKLNLREAIFMVWAGLRGAVGIALAISLDNDIFANTDSDDEDIRLISSQVFGMIGGIAFLTLVINGTSSAFLLQKLGLTDSSPARVEIIQCIAHNVRLHLLDDYIFMLTFQRYAEADFKIVRAHVLLFHNISAKEFKLAVLRNKEDVPQVHYRRPRLDDVLSTLNREQNSNVHIHLEDSHSTEHWASDAGQSHEDARYRQGSLFGYKVARNANGDSSCGSDESDDDACDLASEDEEIDSMSLEQKREEFSMAEKIAGRPGSTHDGRPLDEEEEMARQTDSSSPSKGGSINSGPQSEEQTSSGSASGAATSGDTGLDNSTSSSGETRASNGNESEKRLDAALHEMEHGKRDDFRNASLPAPDEPNSSGRVRRQRAMLLARDQSSRGASRNLLPDSTSPGLMKAVQQFQRRRRTAVTDRPVLEDGPNQKTLERAVELREIFLQILNGAYQKQITNGELSRNGFVDYALLQSLEMASDSVAEGNPINDWDAACAVSNQWVSFFKNYASAIVHCSSYRNIRRAVNHQQLRLRTFMALAFIHAHVSAEDSFRVQFANSYDAFSEAEQMVIDESQAELAKARQTLMDIPKHERVVAVSHLMAQVLLQKQARYVERLQQNGTLKEREAQVFLADIESQLSGINHCTPREHPKKEIFQT